MMLHTYQTHAKDAQAEYQAAVKHSDHMAHAGARMVSDFANLSRILSAPENPALAKMMDD